MKSVSVLPSDTKYRISIKGVQWKIQIYLIVNAEHNSTEQIFMKIFSNKKKWKWLEVVFDQFTDS